MQTRHFTEEEINEICNQIDIPFSGVNEVFENITQQIKNSLRLQLKQLKFFPPGFQKIKKDVYHNFLLSIAQPGEPVGIVAADAIGAPATQSNLNTFHKAGLANTSPIDGLKEVCRLGRTRKVPMCQIHFMDKYLNYKEVMAYKKDFIGLSVMDLLSDKPYLYIRDFDKPFEDYWYEYYNINPEIFSGERISIRLKFDIEKLFEYRITPSEIANVINRSEIKMDKKINPFCVASPLIDGTLDIYIKSDDLKNDISLVLMIQNDELSKIIIKGISGIRNFYPTTIKITTLINTIKKSDISNGAIVFLNREKIRTSGIPIFRLEEIIEKSGGKLKYPTCKYGESMFEFSSIKRETIEYIVIATNEKIQLASDGKYSNIPKDNKLYRYSHFFRNIEFVENISIDKFRKIFNSDISIRPKGMSYMYFIHLDLTYMNRPSQRRPISELLDRIFKTHIILQNKKMENTYQMEVEINIPFDEFSKNLNSSKEEYVFAETLGDEIVGVLKNPYVDIKKSYCSNFRYLNAIYGIEALRNYLVYELHKIITSTTCYVNHKYIQLIADVLTHSGLNPMTSEISHSSVDTGAISSASFDRVWSHIFKSALSGKREITDPISTSILIGKEIKIGTGYNKVICNEIIKEYTIQTNKRNEEIAKNTNELERIVDENVKTIPVIVSSYKLPEWIFSRGIIYHDYSYYISKKAAEITEETHLELIQPSSIINMLTSLGNILFFNKNSSS